MFGVLALAAAARRRALPPPAATPPLDDGWLIQYHLGTNFETFFAEELVAGTGSGATGGFDQNWSTAAPRAGMPNDNWSVRLAARRTFADSANYTFSVGGDDGVRLFIDGAPVTIARSDGGTDSWRNQAYTVYTATVPIGAGVHTLTVEHFDAGVAARLSVAWAEVVEPAPVAGFLDYAATWGWYDADPRLSRQVNYGGGTTTFPTGLWNDRFQPDLETLSDGKVSRPALERNYSFALETNSRFVSTRNVKIELRGQRSITYSDGVTRTNRRDDFPDRQRERAEFGIPRGGAWFSEDGWIKPGHELYEEPGVARNVFHAASFRPGPCWSGPREGQGTESDWTRPTGSADPDGWVWGTCWDLHRPNQTGVQTEPATWHVNCEGKWYIQWSGGQPGTFEASTRKKVDFGHLHPSGSAERAAAMAVNPGAWTDIILDYKVATIAKGWFKCYRRVVADDGTVLLPWTRVIYLLNIPTLQASATDPYSSLAPAGQIHYWKNGFYRSYETFTTIWRTGGLVRASTWEQAHAAMWAGPVTYPADGAYGPAPAGSGFDAGFDAGAFR